MSDMQVKKNGLAVTSLVLGIVAILGSWMPILNNFSFILAILGLIFGIFGLVKISKAKGKKTYTIIALIINAVAIAIVLSSQAAYSAAIDSINEGPKAVVNGQPSTDLTVGQSATLDNGLVLTVDSFERNVSAPYMSDKFTAVTVTIKNDGKEKQSFNPFDWKSIDANGAESDYEIMADSDDKLESGNLNPGGTVTGVIYFKNNAQKIAYVSGLKNTTAASWNLD